MNVFTIAGKEYSAPSAFSELTADQLLYFSELYAQNLPASDILRKVSMRWITWNYSIYRKLNNVQRLQISRTGFEWLYGEYAHSNNLIKSFWMDGVEFFGYLDKLVDVKVVEFAVADAALKSYQKTKSDDDLLMLVACLYRPKDKSKEFGDVREPFNEDKCRARIEKMKDLLPKKYWYAILFNFTAVRRFVQNENRDVFGSGGSGPDFGIPGMVHEMSGPELGTVDYIMNEMSIRNLLFFAKKIKLTSKQKKKPISNG